MQRGVSANRHETWGGMRWTRQCRVRMRSQGGAIRERSKDACKTSGVVADVKACGPGTRCWCQVLRRHTQPDRDVGCRAIRLATVAKGIRHRGERAISVKTIAW